MYIYDHNTLNKNSFYSLSCFITYTHARRHIIIKKEPPGTRQEVQGRDDLRLEIMIRDGESPWSSLDNVHF